MQQIHINPNQHLIDATENATDLWDAEQCARAAAHAAKAAKPKHNFRAFWAVAHKAGLNPDDRTGVLIAISLFFGRPVLSRRDLSPKEFNTILTEIEWRRLTW